MDLTVYLSPSRIARRTGYSEATIRQALKRNEIDHVVTQMGRMATPAAVEAWLASRRARGLAVPVGA